MKYEKKHYWYFLLNGRTRIKYVQNFPAENWFHWKLLHTNNRTVLFKGSEILQIQSQTTKMKGISK